MNNEAPDKRILDDAKKRMKASVENFRSVISGIHAGVAHPGLVENLLVDLDGSQIKLKQVATIRAHNDELHIAPWDQDNINKVSRALSESEKFNPRIDSAGGKKVIIITVPRPSGEYRKKLAADVLAESEKAKISLRNVRRDSNEEIEKLAPKKKDKNVKSAMSEDEVRKLSTALDKITNEHVIEIGNLATSKQKDIMTT